MSKQIDAEKLIEFVVRNAWRESTFACPDPEYHVAVRTLFDWVRDFTGMTPEQIDAVCVRTGDEMDAE